MNAIPIKNTTDSLQRAGTDHLKICVESERTPNGHRKSSQENHSGGSTMPDFRLRCKAVLTKTVGTSTKTDTSINGTEEESRSGPSTQWSRPHIRPSRRDHPLEKKTSLFHKCHWECWTATCRGVNLDHCLTPDTKINSKWMKDVNAK